MGSRDAGDQLRHCNKITIAKIAKEPILVHGDQ